MDNLRNLLGIRRMDKDQNSWINKGVVQSDKRGVDEGLMKAFSKGSAICSKWRMTGLLRGSI